MTTLLSAILLVSGAAICLIAALGVLRLPDFFLRMHAATKAGVAGAGLVLIGVAFAEPSLGMWIKVALAISFLLMTTPVAGHLLARAGYVAGVPLWGGTYQNQLEGELQRGQFEALVPRGHQAAAPVAPRQHSGSVIVALTSGSCGEEAADLAFDIARATGAPLMALAIIDTKLLSKLGPVPIGGNHYAAQLRRDLTEKARNALAELVQTFERKADHAGISFSIAMEEGDPVKILKSRCADEDTLLVARDGWFDHGIAGGKSDPLGYLVRRGVYPLVGVASRPAEVWSVTFIHDGTPHSDRTLDWLIERDPWPSASIHMFPDSATRQTEIAGAKKRAAEALGRRLIATDSRAVGLARSQVIVFGNEGHDGWTNMMRASSRPRLDDVPIVVFG